jgi:tol-pal system protein YbgF
MTVTGCATKGDLRGVEGQLRAVSVRQDSLMLVLQEQRRATADTLRTQSGQLVDLRGDISQQLRRILEELDGIRELSGQNQRAIASIQDQIESIRGGTGASRVSPLGGGRQNTPQQAAAADDMYEAAMQQFNRGSLGAARIGFNQFLTSHPTDELAPLAHYNLADILVQEGRLEDAVQRFLQIRELFPADAKVADALYRVGLCYRDLNNAPEARRYLQLVVNTYPDSQMAGLAQDRLDEIGR